MPKTIKQSKKTCLALNHDFKKNYVVLRYNNQNIGIGLVLENRIKNQVPKGRKLKNQI